MNLLSLGSAQRRLFAIHEPAAPSGQPTRAVVLCQPLGTEYTYAHRSMRQLALRLAMSGCHTLRFDYYGTGDSAGDTSETDPAGCEADIETAMEALADIAGISTVALLGLRAGANLAASVAARRAAAVNALVLWDPLVEQPGDQQMLGRAAELGLPQRTAVFVTEDAKPPEQLIQAGLHGGPGRVTIELVAAPCAWVETATTTGALPVALFQRVVAWLQ